MEDSSDTSDPLSILLIIKDILESSVFHYAIQSLSIILLLLLTGFISSLELAFHSLTTENINSIKTSKDAAEKRINRLYLKTSQALATLRILKNAISVCIASITIWQIGINNIYTPSIAFIVIVVLTMAIVFFNEIFPKILIKERYFSFAKKTSLVFLIMFKVFQPLYNLLIKLYSPKDKRGKKTIQTYSEGADEDISIDDTEEIDEVEEDSREEILSNASFELISVKQIMVNRLDILAFDYDLPFEALLKEVNRHGFSRIPVYKESIDSIEGILYVKDLLIHLERKLEFDWHRLIRPGFFVPDSKKIDDLLKEFQEKKVHMAIVVDEYGGTAGLVTLEDIIEEIVGEINDEFDKIDVDHFSKLDETTYIFEGNTLLEEFTKIYNIERDNFVKVKEEKNTLSDFILGLFGKVPSIGEQITYNQFEFTIIGIEKEKINRVKVFIKEQTSGREQLVGR